MKAKTDHKKGHKSVLGEQNFAQSKAYFKRGKRRLRGVLNIQTGSHNP